jgi:Fe-S-cluster containining protein
MMENSCLRCGRCCTRFGVCLTPFDILRIKDASGKEPAEFVDSIPEPPLRERTEPAVMIEGMPSLIVLKREEKSVCCFYSESGCKVYSGRPMLCRSYPFRVPGTVLNLTDVRSRACVRRWLPEGEGRKQYLRDCLQYGAEVKAYMKIAQEWNKTGGSIGEFLAFAARKASESPLL